MALYIYPSELRTEVEIDRFCARAGGATTLGINSSIMRHAVRVLMNHDLLLLPAQVSHHSPNVQRLQQVALLCGITVRPVTNYTKPAPAPAARQTQQSAGAGNL